MGLKAEAHQTAIGDFVMLMHMNISSDRLSGVLP
jgi:hypothetical protein